MKKIIVTQEMIKEYYKRNRTGSHRFKPAFPYCKLCSILKGKHGRSRQINYFEVGEEVYKIEYPNGTHGLYHIDCVDNPKDEWHKGKVEDLLRYDVDKWTGLDKFVKSMRKQSLSPREMMAKIESKYKCSHITAYRQLRRFITLVP